MKNIKFDFCVLEPSKDAQLNLNKIGENITRASTSPNATILKLKECKNLDIPAYLFHDDY